MPSFTSKSFKRKKRQNNKLRQNISAKKLYTKNKKAGKQFRRVARGIVADFRKRINTARLTEADRNVVKQVVEQADRNVVKHFRKGIATIKRQRQKKQLVNQFISGIKTLKKKREEGQQRERLNIERGNECSICLDPMTPADATTILPCGHKFHSQCIHSSFQSNGNRCPLCRIQTSNHFVNNMLSTVSGSQQAPPVIVSQEPRAAAEALRASVAVLREGARNESASVAQLRAEVYDETSALSPRPVMAMVSRARDEAFIAREAARVRVRVSDVMRAFRLDQERIENNGQFYDEYDESVEAIATWIDMVAPAEAATAAATWAAWVAATAVEEVVATAADAAMVATIIALGFVDESRGQQGLIGSVWRGTFVEPPGWDNTSRTANFVNNVRTAKAIAEARGIVPREVRADEAARDRAEAAGAAARAAEAVLETRLAEALTDEELAASLDTALARAEALEREHELLPDDGYINFLGDFVSIHR